MCIFPHTIPCPQPHLSHVWLSHFDLFDNTAKTPNLFTATRTSLLQQIHSNFYILKTLLFLNKKLLILQRLNLKSIRHPFSNLVLIQRENDAITRIGSIRRQFLRVHFSMLGNENVRRLKKCLLMEKRGSKREWDGRREKKDAI